MLNKHLFEIFLNKPPSYEESEGETSQRNERYIRDILSSVLPLAGITAYRLQRNE